MNVKRLLLPAGVVLLAAVSTFAQSFPTAPRTDTTPSYGTFKILVEPGLTSLVSSCPGFSGGILTSPPLYDPNTTINESAVRTLSGGPLPVPRPPSWGPPVNGGSTREVPTQITSLHMSGAGGVKVTQSPAFASSGEVEQINGGTDFPAHSIFHVFVQIEIPAAVCPGLSGAVLYNKHNEPLKVLNAEDLHNLPPTGIVYVHDETSVVPIRFVSAGPSWKKDQVFGCIVFAGHGLAENPHEEETAGQKKFHEKIGKLEGAHTAKACPRIRAGGPSVFSIGVLGGLIAAWAIVALLRRRRQVHAFNG